MYKTWKNKYRVETDRARFWNYGNAAAYFITICIQDRFPFFGEVEKDKMKLSDLGLWANQSWLRTSSLRPEMNIYLVEHVLMPDHFHALLIIGSNVFNFHSTEALHSISNKTKSSINKSFMLDGNMEESMTLSGLLHPNKDSVPISSSSPQKFGKQTNNLASIVRGFKSSVTAEARKRSLDNFQWQSGYYDRIIQDDQEFLNVRFYIRNNPKRWWDRNR